MLISVKNLGVEFNHKAVLKNVTFDIEKGDILAIIGPNGSGKTLLIRTILGLNKNYTGEVVWHEHPEVSYTPQKMGFERGFPLTVKEFFLMEIGKNKTFWLPSKKMEEDIKSKLAEVKAEYLFNQRLGDLSQGEIQRMFIARSLLENPGIVFFDEPASGIDIGTEETVYNLLYNLHKRNNSTIVLVSHELSIVYKFATKVICLNGEMLCKGTPEEILTPENLQILYGHHKAFHAHEEPNHGEIHKDTHLDALDLDADIIDQHDHV